MTSVTLTTATAESYIMNQGGEKLPYPVVLTLFVYNTCVISDVFWGSQLLCDS